MSMLILLLSFIWFGSAISNKPLLSANHDTNHISISYIVYTKQYSISNISHCFDCFVICFLSNCASFSDLYQLLILSVEVSLFVIYSCLTSFPSSPLIGRFLNMDDIFVKWLQIWLAMFFTYILTVFLFVFYIHDSIYDAINIVRNMVKK